jgi:hypothetical protein
LVHRNGWSAVLHLDGRFDIITPWDDVRSTYPPDALPRPDLDWGDQPRLLDRQPPPWYTGEDPEDDTDYNALIRARLLLNRLGVAA